MKMQTQSQGAGQASADIQQLQHNLRIGIVYVPVDEIHSYKRTLRKRSRRWQAACRLPSNASA